LHAFGCRTSNELRQADLSAAVLVLQALTPPFDGVAFETAGFQAVRDMLGCVEVVGDLRRFDAQSLRDLA
jgi:hypothetical protein